MKRRCALGCCLAMFFGIAAISAGSLLAGTGRAYVMREDYGMESLSDCYLSYYYYIPCPSYSWFWPRNGFGPGDIIGAWFSVGDLSTGQTAACDLATCFTLDRVRLLEFTGYGNYPYRGYGMDIEYDIYCADEYGCPIGPPLWHDNTTRTLPGWTYIDIVPPISLCSCVTQPGAAPRMLFTITHVGRNSDYLAWGLDNISTTLTSGCVMHEVGSLPALYPRPYSSHYQTMHSGYYGNGGFQYCPPQWFRDGRDSTPDATVYGHCEWAARIYVSCTGPSNVEPVTWGSIKALYR